MEWLAISENFEAVNKALKRAGGEPLKDAFYWSSTENGDYYAWYVKPSNGYMYDYTPKYGGIPVRCLFIEEK